MCLLPVIISSLLNAQTLTEEETDRIVATGISYVDAELIVQAEEETREAQKDQREADLLGEDILETKVVYQGDQRIVFNRVNRDRKALHDESTTSLSEGSEADSELESEGEALAAKEYVSISLGGVVTEDGLSELWWNLDGERYRIVTNANFSWFGGIGAFEDETTRYSVYAMVTPAPYQTGEDRISYGQADFTPGAIEYYVLEAGGDPEAFVGIEAMLRYYAENQERMRTAYENGQKLQKARRAYLEVNPPRKRDIIINYAKD